MSLKRRGKVWWIDFTPPGGRRVRRSLGTTDRRKAQELHDKIRSEAWRITELGEKPKYTWQDAVKRWLKEEASKATLKDDQQRLRWLHRHLGSLYLHQITREVLDQITDAKLAEGVAHATVNRHLSIVRAILRRAAFEWSWLDRVPKFRMLPEPKGRTRWLTGDEAERLARALPHHLAECYRFALATGLRQRNVLQLRWNQTDLERAMAWIHADQAKGREPIGVPLDDEALAILRRQRRKHPVFCFVGVKSEPIRAINSGTWRRALERAGLGREVCWHIATRHTWASAHAMSGTPMHVLQELGGWRTPSMVKRYAHLAPEHLREYANRASRPRLKVAPS